MYVCRLHVMLSVKNAMKKVCRALHGADIPPSKDAAQHIVECAFNAKYEEHTMFKHTLNRQYDIWQNLLEFSDNYSQTDARKAHVDLDFLAKCQVSASMHMFVCAL